MITVWAIFAAEWVLFMTNAWYLDQVGTGSQLKVVILTFFPPVSFHLLLFTLFKTNAWYVDQVCTGYQLKVEVLTFFPAVSFHLSLFALYSGNVFA